MATTEALLTAEEFLLLPDQGQRSELIQGRIVVVNPSGFQHGEICANIAFHLGVFLDLNRTGRVVGNDSGVITERKPDSVRGANVAYYSFARIPQGIYPRGYPAAVPELVFEVRSPTDRDRDLLDKVQEYLDAGVTVVCKVEPDDQTATVYSLDRPAVTLTVDQELTGMELLPGFSLPVRRMFE